MARILIVEDELLIVEDLKYKLRSLGHTVLGHATSGAVAVQRANEVNPELVLMDVRLRGEMNGIEAARRIRESRAIPVVYVTAHAQAVANTIGSQPQHSFLTKPFTIGQL